MKINFQTACEIIAKEQGYNTWEKLLADNEAHTHYYQLAADKYADILDDNKDSIERLTDLQLELGYKRGELSTVAMLGLVGEAGEVLNECSFKTLIQLPVSITSKAIQYCNSVDALKKQVRNKSIDFTLSVRQDKDNEFKAELGDCFYYLNILATNVGLTVWDLAQMAYDKIKRKQSEGGSSEDPKK